MDISVCTLRILTSSFQNKPLLRNRPRTIKATPTKTPPSFMVKKNNQSQPFILGLGILNNTKAGIEIPSPSLHG